MAPSISNAWLVSGSVILSVICYSHSSMGKARLKINVSKAICVQFSSLLLSSGYLPSRLFSQWFYIYMNILGFFYSERNMDSNLTLSRGRHLPLFSLKKGVAG